MEYNNETLPVESRATMLRRLFVFICLTLGGMCLVALLISFIVKNPPTAAQLRISTILQDVIVFIFPAVAIAVVSSRLPARFLSLDRVPRVWPMFWAILALIVSAPIQNQIIAWNEAITLPESMASIERWMRAAEESARASAEIIMGGSTVGDLIMGLLVAGILAGLSEELFFRGALQRIFTLSDRHVHAAIWSAAFIFSAMHFQFYGFLPRLLLGAFFGYVVAWSGSLWIAIIVHALNNMMVVVSSWNARRLGVENQLEAIGIDSPLMLAFSLLLTIAALSMLYRCCRKNLVQKHRELTKNS